MMSLNDIDVFDWYDSNLTDVDDIIFLLFMMLLNMLMMSLNEVTQWFIVVNDVNKVIQLDLLLILMMWFYNSNLFKGSLNVSLISMKSREPGISCWNLLLDNQWIMKKFSWNEFLDTILEWIQCYFLLVLSRMYTYKNEEGY